MTPCECATCRSLDERLAEQQIFEFDAKQIIILLRPGADIDSHVVADVREAATETSELYCCNASNLCHMALNALNAEAIVQCSSGVHLISVHDCAQKSKNGQYRMRVAPMLDSEREDAEMSTIPAEPREPCVDHSHKARDARAHPLTGNIQVEESRSENQRVHLQMIMGVISRMASSSASLKGWLIPLVTAAYRLAIMHDNYLFAFVGILATTLIAYLDVHYLETERKYRDLFEKVAMGDPVIPPFSMNPNHHHRDLDPSVKAGRRAEGISSWLPRADTILSWSILPFYAVIFAIGLGLIIMQIGPKVIPWL